MSEPTAYPASRLCEMAATERPQERLERLGPGALSDTELLAMLLRSGSRGFDVISLSTQLLAEAGSLSNLIAWKEPDFQRLKGIGRVKALQLVTVMEIARRILSTDHAEAPKLDRPCNIYAYLHPIATGLKVEKFWVLSLNRKLHLIKRTEVSSGTATGSLVHPRELFREPIRDGATAIICVHNHPSGDPAPSSADIAVTRQIKNAAQTLQIDFVDHLIMGTKTADPLGRGYYSFKECGNL
jgi:DNA repair protein RadC